ncbi:Putative teichuronic acid biosynthesis glycosyltransferase TuaC [Poriferisphaera corsica]|uniref:Teichuronic acid biosynthesis glycosyltransferase TuaC n=1 Tax=Poriferisphaera corsica TaxID=2528020 RepID=A0A517YRY8_9BACT|nr:glycosyltransferase family 4 protein [Poriferisphaera corsica]QDU32985.1 Putative teichuronic acid biosynthesis glycosyltransferase TuaC [Poriferisphaera corsica]
MKIMHIITRLIQGGAQQNTVMSCRAQVAAGHQVTLVYGPIYGPEGSLLKEAQQSGAKLIELPSMVRSIHPLKDAQCYLALKKLIKQEKPDIVHTHSSKAGIIGRAAASKVQYSQKTSSNPNPGPIIIHTVHGLPFHDHQPKWVHNLYVGLEQFAAKRCHHIIAITPEMVQAFVDKNIAPASKFSVVPSGVDLSRFKLAPNAKLDARKKLNIPQDAVVIANLARLDPLKGHNDLLDIYPTLKQKLGDNTYLLFIGDGFYRKELEQKIKAQNLTDKIIITGYIPHEQVAATLAAADMKVLPSYQEGQSRTLVEALLLGLPIVAYNVGGIPSICNAHTGRLVTAHDHDALAAAIVDTIENKEKTQKLTEAGREFVRKQYSSQAMTDALQHLYDSLRSIPN